MYYLFVSNNVLKMVYHQFTRLLVASADYLSYLRSESIDAFTPMWKL